MPGMLPYEELEVVLPDGYRAYGRYWGVDAPRGAVLYLPGIQSHCGWFEGSARRLWRAGLAVLQVDRRGCGRNREQRGHAESAEQLVGDALAARDELLRRSGCSSFHVVGVSWGGKLAVAAYVADPAGVTGLSLVTPGLFPVMAASGSQRWAIGFAMLYEPLKLIDIPLNEPELFTTNTHWQQWIRDDELTLRQATASFYLASRRLDKLAVKLARSRPVPIHLMLAGEEHIIHNDQTAALVRDLQWPHCRITTYEGARHGLEFTAEAAQFFDDLVGFAVNHAAPARDVVLTAGEPAPL